MRTAIALGLTFVWLFMLVGCGGGKVASVDENADEQGYEEAMESGEYGGGEEAGPPKAAPHKAGPPSAAPEQGPGGEEGGYAESSGEQEEGTPSEEEGYEEMAEESSEEGGEEAYEEQEKMYREQYSEQSEEGEEGESEGYEEMENEEMPEEGEEEAYREMESQGPPEEGEEEGYAEGQEEEMYREQYRRGAAPGQPQGRGPRTGSGRPGAKAAPEPKTFAEMATRAFQQGRDWDAFQYLYAHAVTADKAAAAELLGKMGWVAPLKQPALAVRWAIGIEYNGMGYTGELYPIGKPQKMPERRSHTFGRRGGFGARGAMGEGGRMGYQEAEGGEAQAMGQFGTAGAAGHGPALLQRYTGELGDRLVEGLKTRLERGDYGLVLKEAAASGQQPQAASQPGYPSHYGAGARGEEAYEEEQGPPGGFGARRPSTQHAARNQATQILPGITLLGTGPTKDLLAAAKQVGADVLCVFSISVDPSLLRRTGQVSTSYKMRIYNVATRKKEYENRKALNNIAVQVDRSKPNRRGPDKVEEEMKKLFAYVDSNWKLGPLPTTLRPEHVLGRIAVLLNEPHDNLLPVLAEIRMYHTRGLLQDNHLLLAYQKALANPQFGTTLATGTEEQKKQVIQQWLPRGG